MLISLWDWIIMKADELKEYHNRKHEEWRKENPERWKEINYKAHRKYLAGKQETDPGFMARREETHKKAQSRYQARKRAEMTEEELEEYRRKTRERIAAYRAKKKAEKLAQQLKENGPE